MAFHKASTELPSDKKLLDEFCTKTEKTFETLYQTIEQNINKRHNRYLPGRLDAEHNDFKSVFVAAAVNTLEQQLSEDVAKDVAHKIIEKALRAHRLQRLPTSPKDQCKNVVITGNIAAGKTVLLERLIAQKKIDRSKCAMIDIDEFRDLEQVVAKNYEGDAEQKSWGTRAHEECHMIRRKILNLLEEKAEKGCLPNVVLMTAFLSSRIRRWLTEGNPKTHMYLLYCTPERALKNAHERSKQDGRWIPTERVLDTIGNLATTLGYLFSMESGEGNRLSMEVIDTSDTTIAVGKQGKPVMSGEEIVAIADQASHVQVFKPDTFLDIHKAYYINTAAQSADPKELYKLPKETELRRDVLTNLLPHRVTFHGKNGMSAIKPAGQNHVSQGAIHSVMAGSDALQFLYGGRTLPQGHQKS